MIDINQFIKSSVIKREESFFQKDIDTYSETLRSSIQGKSVLVIGGAASSGDFSVGGILWGVLGAVVLIGILKALKVMQ